MRRRNSVVMDFTNRISRTQIAEQLGVQPQTIAKWERLGSFPAAKEHIWIE
jgi:transcriptional regulator with XRE-family HTH domain